MNRRDFLRTAAVGGLAVSSLPAIARSAWAFAPTKPRRVGLIGSGWYGKIDVLRMAQIEPIEVVSMCDVDKRMLAEAAELMVARKAAPKQPRLYADYRDLLKEKDCDIVFIGTPDHWHALTAIAAMQSGADVYLQKPISVDVVEGQAILATARKLNKVVQIGMQRRSTPHLIEARDQIIRTGKLGKIGLAEMYCYYHMRGRGNPTVEVAPDYLNWDMWCGPAPAMPYTSMAHPRGWRSFMEFSNGIVGDMCVHMFDMVRWILGLGWPKRISSEGGILVDKQSKANIADTQTATFEYDDLSCVWQHRTWGSSADPKYPWGATLYGEKGTLKLSVMGYDFQPMDGGESIHRDVAYEYEKYPEDKTEKDLERHVAQALRWHMKDFLAAVDSRGKPVADVEEGYISTSSCIMANMAMKLGRTLAFDPAAGKIVGDEQANRLLARPYRQPWEHPLA